MPGFARAVVRSEPTRSPTARAPARGVRGRHARRARPIVDLNFNLEPEGCARVAKALEESICYGSRSISSTRPRSPTSGTSRRCRSAPARTCTGAGRSGRISRRPVWTWPPSTSSGTASTRRRRSPTWPRRSRSTARRTTTTRHLATFIAAQWCAAIPNARILEFDVDDVPWRDELVSALPEISAGELRIPQARGGGSSSTRTCCARIRGPVPSPPRARHRLEARKRRPRRVRARRLRPPELALPVVPGRDFGTYLRFYVQMFEWHSVLPMSMLYRTPVAPLVVGGSLDLVGGYGAQPGRPLRRLDPVLDACGPRLRAARRLWPWPSRSSSIRATGSSSTCLRATRSAPSYSRSGRSCSPGPGSSRERGASRSSVSRRAAALTVPGYQVLVVFALVPLAGAAPWRTRLPRPSLSCVGVVVVVLGSWAALNGLRYDDYALARGGGAFFPFYRAFVSDRIVSPDNGPASRELADTVRGPPARRAAVPRVRDHARPLLLAGRPAGVRGPRGAQRPFVGLGLRLRTAQEGRIEAMHAHPDR